MKKIDKIVSVLLIMIIFFQAIFPSMTYGYTEDEALNLYKREINTKITGEITKLLTERNQTKISLLSPEEKTVFSQDLENYIVDLPATLEEYDSYSEIENDLDETQKQNLENNMNDYIENLNAWDFINSEEAKESYEDEGIPQNITLSQAILFVKNKLGRIKIEKEEELIRA